MFKCENPDCQNEHDGSYGSGRFCCNKCRQSFIAKERNKKRKILNIKYKPRSDRAPAGTWVCFYCGRDLETKGNLQKHIHDNHVCKNENGKTIPWNKGLTEKDDERIKTGAKRLREGYKSGRIKPSFLGRRLTKEHKDKMISTYIQNRTNNKYRGNYKGIYFQYSFELAWLVWNFEHGIKVFRCDKTFQYWDSEQQKERTYYPDFKLEDGTIIEIKGRMTQNVLDKQKAVLEQYNGKYFILRKDDIKHCLKYCREKYGNNFVQKLKDL